MVLGLAASRAAQAAQSHDPKILRLVEALRDGLGLGPEECVADHLLACGLGRRVTADQVAACSTRFVEQEKSRGARPEVVVVVGREAQALVLESGLINMNASQWVWAPIGTGRSCSAVPIDDPAQILAEVGAALGTSIRNPRRLRRTRLATRAAELLSVLGKHDGHRTKRGESADWRTLRHPISALLLQEHLKGRLWVAPHNTSREWPYIVLDVDRHNAVQEQAFDATLRKLKRHFPNSLFIRSSSSGGVHVYVRLPKGTYYRTAARWMRAYLTLRDIRWKKITGADSKVIQAELVEVPPQPPRLPFGAGSSILGSNMPLAQQLDKFLGFITSKTPRDYTRAKHHALRMLRREGIELKGRWTPARRRRLDAWILRKELDLTDRSVTAKLPAGDPWLAVELNDLPQHLRHVAFTGIPAYGTRVRWTHALVEALLDRVPEHQVRALMAHWLKNRTHASEDMESDLDYVVQETGAIITGAYRRIRGVPERFWTEIEDVLRRLWRALHRPPSSLLPPLHLQQVRDPHRFDFDDLRKTAFFIARAFYAEGQQERAIFAGEFERFTGSNTAHDVQELLTKGGSWLYYVAPSAAGIVARKFRILLWPRRRGEPSLFVPP
ncbi:hypothetical protein WMF04_24455 [Sorangium sp. So ce260]|uniref:hypothetical protein n=1 Tax=Sorangium sp. So ce260 TaxID=3133291 RepID=UPI003F5D9B4C